MKIYPAGAELFHTDRLDEAHSCFSQFCECTYKLDVRKERTEGD